MVVMETVNEYLREGLSQQLILEEAHENITEWLSAESLGEKIKLSISKLILGRNWEELNDRFYKRISFGTGGMRGRTIGGVITEEEGSIGDPYMTAVGSNMMNDVNVIRATKAFFEYASKHNIHDGLKLVIAYDVRYFSKYFGELVASTWMKLGGEACIFEEPRSTPELSFAVRHLGAVGGVVITASHNPFHDNGFKVYYSDGGQVVSPHAEGIMDCFESIKLSDIGDYFEIDLDKVVLLGKELDEAYLGVLGGLIFERDLRGIKVVYTPLHGTGQYIIPLFLRGLGVELSVVEEQMKQDSRFSTVKSPNPENSEAFKMGVQKAKELDADLVFATDPDADRMGVAVRNQQGEYILLSGNIIGSVLLEFKIRQLKARGIIHKEGGSNIALIKTFVTTPLQEAIGKYHGIKVVNTLTGFKYIGERLSQYQKVLEDNYYKERGVKLNYDDLSYLERAELLQEYSTFFVFGGEESYGYLAADFMRDKDANLAVGLFCEFFGWMKQQGKDFFGFLEEMYRQYGVYEERLLNIELKGAVGAEKIKTILKSYRTDPMSSLGDLKCVEVLDFLNQDIVDVDEKKVPKQDFLMMKFESELTIGVRGSGTEPKIKYYIFMRKGMDDNMDLVGVKNAMDEFLIKIQEKLKLDALRRAEG